MLHAPFEWLYGKLGSRYPAVFVTLELQAGFLVTAATVALLAAYYDASVVDFLWVLAFATALTGAALGWGLHRILPWLQPIRAWIAGARDDESTERAWVAAVGLPLTLVRRELFFPVLAVVLPSCVAAVLILDLSWLDFFPLAIVGSVAVGYGAILHHLTIEAGMRPVLIDINRSSSPRVSAEIEALSLRWRLLLALPMINVITGVVVAAIAGADNLGVTVLVAIGVATTISLELTVLLSRSILGPLADLRRATGAVAEGDFDVAVPVTTADELGDLAASFNQMVDGLRERERIREAFGTYLDGTSPSTSSARASPNAASSSRSRSSSATSSTSPSFAESNPADEVVGCLNELFEVVVPVDLRHGRPRRQVRGRRAAGGVRRPADRSRPRRSGAPGRRSRSTDSSTTRARAASSGSASA